MNRFEKIYSHLPLPLQSLALRLESRRIAARRYAPGFFAKMKEIGNLDRLPPEEIKRYQLESLRRSLAIAGENSPYYRDLFRSADFHPGSLHDPGQLSALPLQDKQILKANLNTIINGNCREKCFMAHTSGTTGSGLIFPHTISSEHHQWATWWRYRLNLGITFGSSCSLFGGRTIVPIGQSKAPFWRELPALHQVYYSMYHLNAGNIKAYVEDMNRRAIPWIHGYPSTISNLAALMLEHGLRPDFPVTHITTGAENLLEHQKKLISTVFGTGPQQHYGLAEPVANISGCINGKLHIDEDFSYVELIPVPGEPGKFEVAGTSFSNDSLLFLRYNTHDIVTLAADQQCSCGRTGRIIGSIDGRQEDSITLPGGTVIGRLDHILKDMVNVREAQIFQDPAGRLVFRIVRGEGYGMKDEEQLVAEITLRLGKVSFNIEYPHSIEKTATGKLRFVVSTYGRGNTQ